MPSGGQGRHVASVLLPESHGQSPAPNTLLSLRLIRLAFSCVRGWRTCCPLSGAWGQPRSLGRPLPEAPGTSIWEAGSTGTACLGDAQGYLPGVCFPQARRQEPRAPLLGRCRDSVVQRWSAHIPPHLGKNWRAQGKLWGLENIQAQLRCWLHIVSPLNVPELDT